MKPSRLRSIATAFLTGAFLYAPSASADLLDFLRDLRTTGHADVAGLSVHRDSNSSKYEEYRDIPQDQPLINDLGIGVDGGHKSNFYADFRAEDVAQDDQRYVLRLGQYGKYEMELYWDELPHVLSNEARTLYQHTGSGTFTLPEGIQQRLQLDPTLAGEIFSEARGFHLGVKRDTGAFSFRYTPTPAWDVRIGYSVQLDDGKRPIGTAFFFGGAQPIETLDPVDYVTHNITGSIQYARAGWSLRLSYDGSLFENGVDALVWDNPFRATDAPGGPSRGRLDLAPDNQAHTISLDGTLELPARTRVVGMVSYGWMLQDDAFLPFTINTALPQFALPASSLDGEIKPFVGEVRLTSRPTSDLTLDAGYRLYDLDNDSRSLVFPGYIAADATPEGPRRSLPYEYTIHRANAGARYELNSWAKTGLEYTWVNWHRRFRELSDSDEHRVGPSLDLVPRRWMALRTSYSHSWRDASGYDTTAPDVSFPEGEEANARLPQLRKFDEAARERDEVSVLATFTPRSTLSLVAAFKLANDDYTRSQYGLLRDTYWSPGIDLAYGPLRILTLYASYTYEMYEYRQRSRERTPVGGEIVDDPGLDWTATGRDKVHTVGGGMNLVLVPKKLTFDLDYSISDGTGEVLASGPNPNAADFPDLKSRFQQLNAIFRYTIRKGVRIRAGYRLERYDEADFATTAIVGGDDLQPSMASDPAQQRSIYLGAIVPNYIAHIAIAGVEFEW